MTVLSDETLAQRAVAEHIIFPFIKKQVRRHAIDIGGGYPAISHGLSSYGYDVTLDRNIQVFSNSRGGIIDPKKVDTGCLVHAEIHQGCDGGEEYVILPPNSYLLGHTVERFQIPNDLLVICLGKSTYARAGVQINVTPIEPGFKGQVVIEISNATSLPVRIYVNEGIAQFVFLQGDRPCTTSYADRDGKYQGQTGITHGKA